MLGVEASGPQYVWEKVPAEEGELVLYTDAQATVAALQARVNELEESRDAWRASQECSEKAYMALVNQIPAERFDYDPVNVALLDGAKEQEIIGRKQIADLQGLLKRTDENREQWRKLCQEAQSQLTQRTAECDALKLVNDTHMKTVMKLSHVVEQRTAEFQRHDGELQQICGQALGYPWFKDDQKNFPGATEKDGVCVGEHVGITIAQELANAYRKRTAELEAVKADTKNMLDVATSRLREQVADLQAELVAANKENARLREALKPFAERWEYFERTKHPSGEWPESMEYADDEPSAIYLGQLKSAKNALDGGKGVQGEE